MERKIGADIGMEFLIILTHAISAKDYPDVANVIQHFKLIFCVCLINHLYHFHHKQIKYTAPIHKITSGALLKVITLFFVSVQSINVV